MDEYPTHSRCQVVVAPIILAVCAQFDDVHIVSDLELVGVGINFRHTIQFEIRRKFKVVIVMVISRYRWEIARGLAMIACELTAEKFNVKTTYGIVTDFNDWLFIRSDDAWVASTPDTPTDEERCVTLSGLRRVTEKIYAMLSDA